MLDAGYGESTAQNIVVLTFSKSQKITVLLNLLQIATPPAISPSRLQLQPPFLDQAGSTSSAGLIRSLLVRTTSDLRQRHASAMAPLRHIYNYSTEAWTVHLFRGIGVTRTWKVNRQDGGKWQIRPGGSLEIHYEGGGPFWIIDKNDMVMEFRGSSKGKIQCYQHAYGGMNLNTPATGDIEIVAPHY